jgi:hypothetical protein
VKESELGPNRLNDLVNQLLVVRAAELACGHLVPGKWDERFSFGYFKISGGGRGKKRGKSTLLVKKRLLVSLGPSILDSKKKKPLFIVLVLKK